MQKPIPPAVWATVQALKNHEAVRRVDSAVDRDGHELIFSIEYDNEGCIIVSFPQDDVWMLQRPDGCWTECFVAVIGHHDGYRKKLEASGYEFVLTADIASLGRASIFV